MITTCEPHFTADGFPVLELPIPDGFADCPECYARLEMHQPVVDDPSWMIATCPACRRRFYLDGLSDFDGHDGFDGEVESVRAVELPRLREPSKSERSGKSSLPELHFSSRP